MHAIDSKNPRFWISSVSVSGALPKVAWSERGKVGSQYAWKLKPCFKEGKTVEVRVSPFVPIGESICSQWLMMMMMIIALILVGFEA